MHNLHASIAPFPDNHSGSAAERSLCTASKCDPTTSTLWSPCAAPTAPGMEGSVASFMPNGFSYGLRFLSCFSSNSTSILC